MFSNFSDGLNKGLFDEKEKPTKPTNSETDLWRDAPIISRYTRRQAIEDGVLVQLSGSGYVGDEWIPKMCREAGFNFPIAMTTEVFFDCVDVHKNADNAMCDIEGRLWDILWMIKLAIKRSRSQSEILFKLQCVVDAKSGHRRSRSPNRPSEIVLKCVCGPDDDASPCLTIMWPEQD